ncbi:MAG: heme ABC exporter ATP-binding protein CcmA [bacterium]|nr:heme ABC exporter ATP-binding protein CcmA [bacterium]
MAGATVPAVVLQDIVQRFGHLTALQGISLNLPEGISLALFGPNGAGKSTLLRLVATLGKPSRGQVIIRGMNTQKEPERVRSEIGIISHQTLLYEDLTASENLLFYGRLYSLSDLENRVASALDEVGLSGCENDRVRGFSRGMKQRLAIARATLHHPAILLLDEPFTGLDTSAKTMLSGMLQNLRQQGRTIILVTHDLARGLALTDQFVILNRGHIVAQDTTEGLTAEGLETLYESKIQA